MQWFFCLSIMMMSHDIHISRAEAEHSVEDQSIQISAHIYIDDLEDAIELGGYSEPLFIGTEKESNEADSVILQYVNRHLAFEINGSISPATFIGKELSEDLLAVWVYLEIYDVTQLDLLAVRYDVLTELYDDQKNIFSMRLPKSGKHFFLFDSEKTTISIPTN